MSNVWQSKRDDKLRITPSEPVRQVLPRRCKGIQPYYGNDMNSFDADVRPSNWKKRRFETSSSSREKIRKIKGQKQPSHSHRRDLETRIEGRNDKDELISSTILSWLVEMKVVKERELVVCLNGTHQVVIGQGMITRRGILCFCCTRWFSISDFPLHRGDLTANKPYENIIIRGAMVSLLTCQIEAWNRHSVPARGGYHHVLRRPRVRDHHDDSCVICADGGELICCEKCPSTYHPKCLGFEGVPQDEWHCPYCCCKYCDGFASFPLLLTCFQCLKKYHWQCSQENDRLSLPFQQTNIPFCGKRCWQLYQILEGMVGRSMPIDSDSRLSWTLVRRMDLSIPAQNYHDLHLSANCNSMVVLASKLMEDSFKLIVDRQTRANMIQSVVYSCGSNFTRTNFSRFYNAVLEFQGHIITVASLRIPSPELMEIPFIATAERCRGNGMCRVLLGSIETELAKKIGVERIVIPSAEDMVRKWQERFEFIPIDKSVERKITTLNTLMFPKTTRLQKVIGNSRRRMTLTDLNLPPTEED